MPARFDSNRPAPARHLNGGSRGSEFEAGRRHPGIGVDYEHRGLRTRTDTVASPRLTNVRPAPVGDRTLPMVYRSAGNASCRGMSVRAMRKLGFAPRREPLGAPGGSSCARRCRIEVIAGEGWRMTVFVDNPQHPAAFVRSMRSERPPHDHEASPRRAPSVSPR